MAVGAQNLAIVLTQENNQHIRGLPDIMIKKPQTLKGILRLT